MNKRYRAISILLAMVMLLCVWSVPAALAAGPDVTITDVAAATRDGRPAIVATGTAASADTVLVLLLRPNADGTAFDLAELDAGDVNAADSRVRGVRQAPVRHGKFEAVFYMTAADMSGQYMVAANAAGDGDVAVKPVSYRGQEERDALLAEINTLCAGAGTAASKAAALAALIAGFDEDERVTAELLGMRLDLYNELSAAARAEACLATVNQYGPAFTPETLSAAFSDAIGMGLLRTASWSTIRDAAQNEPYASLLAFDTGERYGKLSDLGCQKLYSTVQTYAKDNAAATLVDIRAQFGTWTVLARINSATTPSQMLTVLQEENGELGLALDELPTLEYDRTQTLTKLIGKDFADYAAVRSAYAAALPDEGGNGGGTGGGSGPSSSGSGGNKTGGMVTSPGVTPTPLPTQTPGFTDLDTASWAAESIQALVDKNVLSGYGDGTFRPNNSTTREEFVKIVVAAFGLMDEAAACDFTDVPADAWFAPYVASGAAAGVINGMGDGRFGVGSDVTRADIAVMLVRTCTHIGAVLPQTTEQTVFTDGDAIPAYAADAVYTLQQAGVVSGRDDGSFDPMAPASRAEVAKMVYAVLQLSGNQQGV